MENPWLGVSLYWGVRRRMGSRADGRGGETWVLCYHFHGGGERIGLCWVGSWVEVGRFQRFWGSGVLLVGLVDSRFVLLVRGAYLTCGFGGGVG